MPAVAMKSIFQEASTGVIEFESSEEVDIAYAVLTTKGDYAAWKLLTHKYSLETLHRVLDYLQIDIPLGTTSFPKVATSCPKKPSSFLPDIRRVRYNTYPLVQGHDKPPTPKGTHPVQKMWSCPNCCRWNHVSMKKCKTCYVTCEDDTGEGYKYPISGPQRLHHYQSDPGYWRF